MKWLCLTALLESLLLTSPALAWWDMGHMTVAALAYDELDPAVKPRVDALIRLNPQYWQWTADVLASDREKTAFVHAATWADDIKSMTDFISGTVKSDGTHG